MEHPIEPLLVKFENKAALDRFIYMIKNNDGTGLTICQGKCYGHAPELLDALREIVDAADGDGWNQLDATFSKARAVIAKATVPFVCGVQS